MTMSRLALFALLSLPACDKPKPEPEAPTTAPAPTDDAGAPAEGDAGGEPPAGAECRPTGCSGIVCSDADVMTTCEYKPEYACYKDAVCTRQSDGVCGWNKTPELDACLANPPKE